MPQNVLAQDWRQYEDDKTKKGVDARFFSCTQQWEVDYLVRMILKAYPYKSEDAIRTAIRSCCVSVTGNQPRKEFVECVMRKV